VTFSNGVVRARPDVILGNEETGEYEVRALLWDELALDQDSAELIALPLVERVEDAYGEGKVGVVKVLHLVTNQIEEVAASVARGRRTDVEALLATV
jgi:thioester reductase-like protein